MAEPRHPVLVATDVTFCVTHRATDNDDGRAWTACRFRQLFYFEDPMDEHTLIWSDEIAGADNGPADQPSESPTNGSTSEQGT